MSENKAMHLHINMTHKKGVNTVIQTKVNTNESTLKTNCVNEGFIGLWPCPLERGKIEYFSSLSQYGDIK